MANFRSVFRSEVARLARKEVRADVLAVRKAQAEHRRAVAALKREVAGLRRAVAFLEKREKGRLDRAPSADEASGVRFSPKWLKAHRQKLGVSAADYARLVGVSALTIYNWEAGKSRPQAKQVAAWGRVRGLGKREAAKRLALLAG